MDFMPSVPTSQNIPSAPLDQSAVPVPPLETRPKGRGLKILLIAAIVLFFILLSGGGAFAYVYKYKPELMPSFLSSFLKPEDVMKRMYRAMSEIRSFEFEGKESSEVHFEDKREAEKAIVPAGVSGLDVFGQLPQPKDFSTNVSSRGAIDWHNKNDVKGFLLLSFGLGGEGIDFGFFQIPSFNLELDLRKLAKAVYSKINLEIKDDDGILKALPVNFGDFIDKWIKIDLSSSTASGETMGFQGAWEEAKSKYKLTEEDIAKIKELFYDSNLIEVTAKLPEEKIDGVDVFHYRFVLDKDGVKNFVEGLSEIVGDEMIPEETKEAWFKELDNDKVKSPESDIWIGKKDFLVYQTSFSTTTAQDKNGVKVSIKTSSFLKLKNFNRPVAVEEPEASMTLDELLEKTLGAARARARDARRLADMKQAQTALELYYGDNEAYPASVDFSGAGKIASESITYMTFVPKNPEPNDGDCPKDFNYRYERKGTSSYELDFCLGQATGGCEAGMQKVVINPDVYEFCPGSEASFDFPEAEDFPDSDFGIDPLEQSGEDQNSVDSDADGLIDPFEKFYGTDINNPDTDGDGYKDGAEVQGGYDPNGPGKLTP